MRWILMPWKRFADFEGRSRRMEFWMFSLFNLIVTIALNAASVSLFVKASASAAAGDQSLGGAVESVFDTASGIGGSLAFVIYLLYILVSAVPSIAVAVRRLHDRGMSGWWFGGAAGAMLFVPGAGFLAYFAFIVLAFLPGTDGPNRYGPNPKDPFEVEVFT